MKALPGVKSIAINKNLPFRFLPIVFALILYSLYVFVIAKLVFASDTSNFTQTITAGTLSVDIVNGSYLPVGSPTVAMGDVAFSFACQTATGTFGTASQQIYVKNPDAADGGWNVTLAATNTTNVWDGASSDFDFNDPTGSGCTDGADAGDSVGGQMSVDALTNGVIDTGACSGCSDTGVSKGSAASFSEGATNSITILTGAAGSDDVGDWTLQTVDISQKIPAEQGAASDYDINMKLTII